jgi:hypothetical protein
LVSGGRIDLLLSLVRLPLLLCVVLQAHLTDFLSLFRHSPYIKRFCVQSPVDAGIDGARIGAWRRTYVLAIAVSIALGCAIVEANRIGVRQRAAWQQDEH